MTIAASFGNQIAAAGDPPPPWQYMVVNVQPGGRVVANDEEAKAMADGISALLGDEVPLPVVEGANAGPWIYLRCDLDPTHDINAVSWQCRRGDGTWRKAPSAFEALRIFGFMDW